MVQQDQLPMPTIDRVASHAGRAELSDVAHPLASACDIDRLELLSGRVSSVKALPPSCLDAANRS